MAVILDVSSDQGVSADNLRYVSRWPYETPHTELIHRHRGCEGANLSALGAVIAPTKR